MSFRAPTASVRRLAPHDASQYRTMMLEAYERHPDAFTSSAAERASLPLTWWEARLKEGSTVADMVLGAFQGNRLVAVAGLSFETRAKARHKATLFGMYVSSAVRRSGIGKLLVLGVLEQARMRDGVRLVQLTVTQGNDAAQSLYERCGFTQFGVEPFAICVDNDFHSKVHMWCDLKMES
ncbi:MAG: GNAT family N-acetyltransferase [Usitatibacter sp.]